MKIDNKNKAPILVVDDDDLVLKTLVLLVSMLGYKCSSASHGLEAVEILKTNSFDLVLTDVNMPGMDGLELLSHITQHYPNTDVIVATGFSERASYADVIKAGAIDYIKKPIDKDELEAKLARALRERAMLQELEQLSTHDSLTSLLNRRAFDVHFNQEMERAIRQGYSLFLAILDIDNFKAYNDTHGHQNGDEILIYMGELLIECTRNSVDLCFRIGGDEFAIILPQTSSGQATEISQRILTQYAGHGFDTTSLSIGVVSCVRNPQLTLEEDIKQMKDRADHAMYDAKKKGKNCIICWP